MPCFHTHWLVALNATDSAPEYVRKGRDLYVDCARRFRRVVHEEIEARGRTEARGVTVPFRSFVLGEVEGWEEMVRNKDKPNWEISCFSAYMLGACGPDFWMCPSAPLSGGLIPSMADLHFDLGHYNRTHAQFLTSIKALAGKTDAQSKIERSYFCGMATHFAADLVVHQLVNVSAGAYALLSSEDLGGHQWENEHGMLFKNIFNTHNKVEHFWDTFIRYRYLGDLTPFWEVGWDKEDWFEPECLLTVDSLLRLIGTPKTRAAKDCVSALQDPSIRFRVEKAITFPWVACDTLLRGDLQPFIYARVVDKAAGAYPRDLVSAHIAEESTTPQMKHWKLGLSEGHKLGFFSSDSLAGDAPTSFNYLTFIACPNVERAQKYGYNSFYHFQALRPFLEAAVVRARTFLTDLTSGYDGGGLHYLKRFWNLDTGLSLRLKKIRSATTKDVITEVDFGHVLDTTPGGGLDYTRAEAYLVGKNFTTYPLTENPGFPVYRSDRTFKDIESVCEDRSDAFLDRIPVEEKLSSDGGPQPVATCSVQSMNVIVARQIAARLNLSFRIGIADLEHSKGRCEAVGMFFVGDAKKSEAAVKETKKWIRSDCACRCRPKRT